MAVALGATVAGPAGLDALQGGARCRGSLGHAAALFFTRPPSRSLFSSCSFVGINETASADTRMVLRHCLLHVGLSAMKGRLEVEDSCVKCSGDSLFATADATLALRR